MASFKNKKKGFGVCVSGGIHDESYDAFLDSYEGLDVCFVVVGCPPD